MEQPERKRLWTSCKTPEREIAAGAVVEEAGSSDFYTK